VSESATKKIRRLKFTLQSSYLMRVNNKKNRVRLNEWIDLSVYVTGLHNTLQDLLTEHVAKKSHCWPLTSAIKPAAGNISVFIGLKGSPKELGLTAQNLWIYSGSNTEDVRVWAFEYLLILSNDTFI
jgi:hypothetical protein